MAAGTITFMCYGLFVMQCEMPAPTKTTVTVCPQVRTLSKADQQALAAELRAAPPGPHTQRALAEWASVRGQAAACRRRGR